jgi:hypothetical protein
MLARYGLKEVEPSKANRDKLCIDKEGVDLKVLYETKIIN